MNENNLEIQRRLENEARFHDVSFTTDLRQKADKFYSIVTNSRDCLLYTSDAADERSSVDLGGRRIIKKKKKRKGDR